MIDGGLVYKENLKGNSELTSKDDVVRTKNIKTMTRRVRMLSELKEYCIENKIKTIELSKNDFRNTYRDYLTHIKDRKKKNRDDEGVISWMEEFINKNKKTFADKYEFDVIYRKFMMSFDEYVVRNWEKTRFKKSIYDLCSINGWEYNPHKNGSNVSQKRWKVGPAGNQKEYLRINI